MTETRIRKCKTPIKFNKKLIEYLSEHESNLEFLSNFWGLEETEGDKKKIVRFVNALKLRLEGFGPTYISRHADISKNTASSWFYKGHLPLVVRLLENYLELGEPQKGMKWLSLNNTSGELYKGPWIAVPVKLESFEDLKNVVWQLPILPAAYENSKSFDLDKMELDDSKMLFFAYLLGVMVGDSSKDLHVRKRRNTRRIKLGLTRRYETNIQFGNFTSFCANCLGLRMRRISDQSLQLKSKHGLFRWLSQSSAFIEWIFTVCLGLEKGQTTTYNKLNADWILDSTEDFKTCFLQGLADSDGFIDITNGRVGIIAQPNEALVKRLVQSFGINSYILNSEGMSHVMMSSRKAFSIPLFSPIARTHRFIKLEKMNKAKRFKRWPIWLNEEVNSYIKNGLGCSKIIENVLDKHSVFICGETVSKRRKDQNRVGDECWKKI